jgi:hypothetical protein
MEFKITSKCGKYIGRLIVDDTYDSRTRCEVSLVNENRSHWLFDWISTDPNGWRSSRKKYGPEKYGIYNQYGELVDMSQIDSPEMIMYFDEHSIGWYCYMNDMRAIVEHFEEMFKWLTSGIDQFNMVINS